jgi:hypothetical protein
MNAMLIDSYHQGLPDLNNKAVYTCKFFAIFIVCTTFLVLCGFIWLIVTMCKHAVSFKFLFKIAIIEIIALCFYIMSALFLLLWVDWDNADDKTAHRISEDWTASIRSTCLAIFYILDSLAIYMFAFKYKHTSNEIPMMYDGALSNMEHTTRYRIFTYVYVLFLVLFNGVYAWYNYSFLKC